MEMPQKPVPPVASNARRAAVLGLALIAAAALAPAPAGAAGSGPSCASSFDPYAADEATLQRCGMTVHPLQSSTVADSTHAAVPGAAPSETAGARVYTYDLEGMTVRTVIPPPSFDPLTASSTQLEDYALPARPPAGSEALPGWEQMMRKLKWITPPTKLVTVPFRAGGHIDSQIWSGLANVPLAGTLYEEAVAQYLEPNIGPTACTPNSVIYWAGIGGLGSGTLAQAGTSNNTAGMLQNQGWWEILPASAVAVPFYATQGGSTFTQAVVAYQLNNQWAFSLYDQATGATWTSSLEGGPIDASSAEYVVERPRYQNLPGYGRGFAALSNFGHMRFTNTQTNSRNPYEYPNESLQMLQGTNENLVPGHAGDILASTEAYGGFGAFTDVWRGCN
jgi:Peptidase A4 family